MAALRTFSNWNKRTSDLKKQIEPYRKYIFICEGKNTEAWYVRRLIEMKKELGIHPMIDVSLNEENLSDFNSPTAF